MSRRTKAEVETIKHWIFQLCEQYAPMTVRQLFYALTVRNLIAKTEQEYKTIVRWAKEMRLAGDLPWEWLADNTRWMHKPTTYGGLDNMLQRSQHSYRRALWDPAKNSNYVEVWLEKDALTGVFYDVTSKYDVPLMPCRGYPSLSFLRNAADAIVRNLTVRMNRWNDQFEAAGGEADVGKMADLFLSQFLEGAPRASIYYFGDFDPSGVDISRSTEARLREFIQELGGTECNDCFTFERVAVNHEQIESMGLPTRPTKKSDSRSKNFGHEVSVEVDAIDPDTLRDMIRNCITPHIDEDELDRLMAIEQMERQTLGVVGDFLGQHDLATLRQRLAV